MPIDTEGSHKHLTSLENVQKISNCIKNVKINILAMFMLFFVIMIVITNCKHRNKHGVLHRVPPGVFIFYGVTFISYDCCYRLRALQQAWCPPRSPTKCLTIHGATFISDDVVTDCKHCSKHGVLSFTVLHSSQISALR